MTTQTDRRRINPPAGGTAPPIFAPPPGVPISTPARTRALDEHRKIFLRTGVVPSASGSAYYEVAPEQPPASNDALFNATRSSLKITCTVHGPRPLPRNAAFSPNLLLSTHVKFAPFATRRRRGYVRDAGERDLAAHLETALRGVVIGERWPKSGCEVVLTVLEGGEGTSASARGGDGPGWGMMNVLAGCVTVASAALVDAGIDCVDLVSGGVAAAVASSGPGDASGALQYAVDPSPSEQEIKAACVVAYLQSRDEITELWLKGETGSRPEVLIDRAVDAAAMTRTVLVEAIREAAEQKLQNGLESINSNPKGMPPAEKNVVMHD